MMAKLTKDDQVEMRTIARGLRNKVRSCLVLAGEYLIQLGGVEKQFDYLNMGAEADNIKILRVDPKESKMFE